MRIAAIYARVSSEQQREEHTIASQTAALIEFAQSHDLEVPKEWVFEDEGFSGAILERPGLERVRDLAAEGQIQVAARLCTGPTEPQVRVPNPADRRVRSAWSRDSLCEGAAGRERRRSATGSVPRHDRRVRAGADSGARPVAANGIGPKPAKSVC